MFSGQPAYGYVPRDPGYGYLQMTGQGYAAYYQPQPAPPQRQMMPMGRMPVPVVAPVAPVAPVVPIAAAPVAPIVAPAQPPAVAGVSAVLDYDLDQMTKFVSWLSFGLMKRQDNPSMHFHSAVRSVLSATRLPKSTLILALLYLSDKMELQPESLVDDDRVFENLVISLVISNKFNDDNTFHNKSWSDATGLDVKLINRQEAAWLTSVNWRLHYREGYSCIEECWQTWCTKFSRESALAAAASACTTPVHQAPYASYMSSPSSQSSLFSDTQFSPSHTPLDLSSPLWDSNYRPDYQLWMKDPYYYN